MFPNLTKLTEFFVQEKPALPVQPSELASELFADVASERTNKIRISLVTAYQIDGIAKPEQQPSQPSVVETIPEAPKLTVVEPVAKTAVTETMNDYDDPSLLNIVDIRNRIKSMDRAA